MFLRVYVCMYCMFLCVHFSSQEFQVYAIYALIRFLLCLYACMYVCMHIYIHVCMYVQ